MTSNNQLTLQSLNTSNSVITNDLLQLETNFARNNGTRVTDSILNRSNLMVFDESKTKVAVRITATDVDKIRSPLEAMGFETIATAPKFHFLEGMIPLESISELESLSSEGMMGVLPVYAPMTSVGSVTSQADFVLESDRTRNALPSGFDGAGIQIGVLSDSYNNLGGAADDILSGDLPAAGVKVLEDLASDGSDEGRAMLQLIHDLAPGAELSFATAFDGEQNFADNIEALAKAGADIIVDDIFYFTEPYFQDGVIAQAVDRVVANNGVSYFSAAGNLEDQAYESTNFAAAPDSEGFFEETFHDFDPGAGVDTRQSITIGAGQSIILGLQWDDPFFTTDGVDTDLAIGLLEGGTNTLVAGSLTDNIANQTPIEIFEFTNTSDVPQQFDILITLDSGPQPGRIKYVNFGSNFSEPIVFDEFETNSTTITPHAAAVNASAVAAIAYFEQDTPQDFTSIGPSTILFDDRGNRLNSPEIRQKPDIAAIDGTNTTFFGNDLDGDEFPNFFGTSAAAPHAAAVAALVQQANPNFTPAQIYNRLSSTAEDIGAPGFDNVTGFGLINAYDAVFGEVVPTALDFRDDFEDGDLPIAYATNSDGAGRIQVTGENQPIGSKHLTLDSSFGLDIPSFDTFSLNEVILNLDATGSDDVILSFDQKEFADEDNPMPATFTGSVNADGVALSVDGTNWFRLISLTGSASTNSYQNNTFNLSNFANTNGLTLGSNVQIKFQQFDDFPIASDGFAFDNISVTGATAEGQTIIGDNSDNSLNGTAGDDTIRGLDGNDLLSGLNGNDLLFGGKENDALFGANGNDSISGGAGVDTLVGGSGNDTLEGKSDRDLLNGGDDRDFLLGGAEKDTLIGGNGNDTLDGGSDDDFLLGGNGLDELLGNAGRDTFALESVASSDRVIVKDFTNNRDILGLSGGLAFADLTIADDDSNSATLITETNTGEILAELSNIDASAIDSSDFITVTL